MNKITAKPVTPTLASRASACLHSWRQECFADPARKRAPDASLQKIMDRGLEHERRLVATLKGVEEVAFDGDWAKGIAATLELMRKNVPWIYQGVLAAEGIRGRPDLLQRTETGYIPVDVKSHKGAKGTDKVQLAVYARLLGLLLGEEPVLGRIWDAQDLFHDVDLARFRKQRDALLERMAAVGENKEPTQALHCGACEICPWYDLCEESWIPGESLTLVRGAAKSTVEKLQAAGIKTVRDLLAASPEAVAKKTKLKLQSLETLQVHARASAEGKPVALKKAKFPSGLPIYFYDVETFEGLTYLHGAIRMEGKKREERTFFAARPEEAADAWKAFLDWVSRDEKAVVYTWTGYENGCLKDLRERFGADEAAYGRLWSSLVDMKVWVERHWALPVRSYSIKKVAPVFGFSWQAEDAGGLNSEIWYADWLKTGDPALRTKVLEYNLDDVRAMERIYEGLKKDFPS